MRARPSAEPRLLEAHGPRGVKRPPARAFDVATDNPMMAGVAGRYASALFELAHEQNKLDEVDGDLGRFQGLLDQSADLNRLVKSPAFAAEDQDRALKAVMDWASIGATTGNFLRVVARNRRLFAAEDMIRNFRSLLARHRGELVGRGDVGGRAQRGAARRARRTSSRAPTARTCGSTPRSIRRCSAASSSRSAAACSIHRSRPSS